MWLGTSEKCCNLPQLQQGLGATGYRAVHHRRYPLLHCRRPSPLYIGHFHRLRTHREGRICTRAAATQHPGKLVEQGPNRTKTRGLISQTGIDHGLQCIQRPRNRLHPVKPVPDRIAII